MKQTNDIIEKANKCLNCKNAKCKQGCPISTNIPEFINEIKVGNLEKAYYILQENNLMSEICSNVCPVEKQCMGSCIKGIKEEPTQINYLEKFINEWANDNNIIYQPEIKEILSMKIAVIGSGPAGLACAIELRKAGCNVTIFEKEEKCGGILEYGIPDFRLSKKIVKNLISKIEQMGIQIKTKIEFGKDIDLDYLKKQGFESIFLATGAQKASIYTIATKENENIYKYDDFLKKYNNGEKNSNLGITVVIGGGNAALDSARTAIRMGAKEVYILYRRNKELMPARDIELQQALEDGVKIIYQTKVISAKIECGKIKEIECIKTKIEDNNAVDIENSNYTIKANTIIFAIGSKINTELFNNQGIKIENELISIDNNYMTNIKGVYAGGDLVENKSSVCRAIATGKAVAKAIISENKNEGKVI